MKINLLDCTLRDGGYINNFKFGNKKIRRIIKKLYEAKIDIIECGFLRENTYDKNTALFENINQIDQYIENDGIYAAMIASGEMPVEKIGTKNSKISIIRLTFHNSEWEQTKKNAVDLTRKGYDVFIQPVGTISYTDEELLKLIKEVNELQPTAFYIVDTLGSMYSRDLIRIFYLIDHNLNEKISIGFHSHNNLQLAFSNALALISIHTKREIIIDCSCFGMGRGAGNLPTELLAQYINDNIENRYNLTSLFEIIDDELLPIYSKTPWGYSIPYFLAASQQCHPSYASFLINKKTITATAIKDIIDKIPRENRIIYDQKIIEKLYLDYQTHKIDDSETIKTLRKKLSGANILLVAPGQSVKTEIKQINKYISDNKPLVITLNFVPDNLKPDMLFISNKKRFQNIDFANNNLLVIVTSNIESFNNLFYIADYSSLLSDTGGEIDNSGVMALRLLLRLNITDVALAGFDGFKPNEENYYSGDISGYLESDASYAKTKNIAEQIKLLKEKMNIKFVTRSEYEDLM